MARDFYNPIDEAKWRADSHVMVTRANARLSLDMSTNFLPFDDDLFLIFLSILLLSLSLM